MTPTKQQLLDILEEYEKLHDPLLACYGRLTETNNTLGMVDTYLNMFTVDPGAPAGYVAVYIEMVRLVKENIKLNDAVLKGKIK